MPALDSPAAVLTAHCATRPASLRVSENYRVGVVKGQLAGTAVMSHWSNNGRQTEISITSVESGSSLNANPAKAHTSCEI
jgi:hypothetical protein